MDNKNNMTKETSKEIYIKEFIYKENKLKKFGLTYGLLILTIAVFIFFTVLEPKFASGRNILNLLAQSSIIGILALGLTNIIISGNFDISFASNAAICSILVLIFGGHYGMPILIAYLLVLGIAIGISIINGLIII